MLRLVKLFSGNLQNQNLIFGTVARKCTQIKNSFHQLLFTNYRSFQKHAIPLLKLSHEQMVLTGRLCIIDLIDNDDDLNKYISKFTSKTKYPDMAELIAETHVTLRFNDFVLLVFSFFNIIVSLPKIERIESFDTLSIFYGS